MTFVACWRPFHCPHDPRLGEELHNGHPPPAVEPDVMVRNEALSPLGRDEVQEMIESNEVKGHVFASASPNKGILFLRRVLSLHLFPLSIEQRNNEPHARGTCKYCLSGEPGSG